jgi:CRISPR-associated protein Cas1
VELLPARMLNEMAYCPRLYALEHIFGDFEHNEHTVEGRVVHRRVDRPTTATLPDPEDPEDPERPRVVRRVHLSDPGLRLVAILDLVEVEGGKLVPVDYKKGRAPSLPEGAWEPERVQVCAQVLLLRAHGYDVDHGILYFAASKKRVVVRCDEALIARTLDLRDEALALLDTRSLPPPLVDSPKCQGCSLVTICLPDEHHVLTGGTGEVRPLVPARDDAIPLHVQLQAGRASLSGG